MICKHRVGPAVNLLEKQVSGREAFRRVATVISPAIFFYCLTDKDNTLLQIRNS